MASEASRWEPMIIKGGAYIREIWLKCQQVSLAWHPQWGTTESFGQWLMQRDSMFFSVIENDQEVGIVYSEKIVPNMDAWVGIIMFDRTLRGREEVIHAVLEEMFKIGGLARLSMLVPRSREVVAKLSRRLGFRHEGVIRRAYRSKNGIFEDCDIFGLIVEDLWRYQHRTVEGPSPDGSGVLERDGDAREVCAGTMDRIMDELAPQRDGHSDRIDEEPTADGSDRGSPGS